MFVSNQFSEIVNGIKIEYEKLSKFLDYFVKFMYAVCVSVFCIFMVAHTMKYLIFSSKGNQKNNIY